MKLPPKKRGLLPVSWGDPVEGEYYECCNGLAVVCRPLRKLYEKDRKRNTVVVQRKSGPWNVVIVASGMRIMHREKWYFTKVAEAIAFAEAAIPLLVFFDINPTLSTEQYLAQIPTQTTQRKEAIHALGELYATITGLRTCVEPVRHDT